MTAAEVLAILKSEVGDQWQRGDWPHGVELDRCVLNPPEMHRFVEATSSTEELDLWVVLEEDPINRRGYRIVLDPESRQFGLATKGNDGKQLFLGLYGGFVETLESM